MLLLVTRPLPDALETAERLNKLGHRTLVQPLMRIMFAPPPRDLAEPGALLITSRNALRAIQAWPIASGWRDKPLFAVGKATAREAAAAGFRSVRWGGSDAVALAEVVREELSPGFGPLLYPAARQRTGGLSETLTEAGFVVETVETYRADPVNQLDLAVRKALNDMSIEGVLIYSRRTAEAFRAAVTRAGLAGSLGSFGYYVLSEQVGEALAGLEAEIQWPERPEEALLLGLIGKAAR